MISSIFCFAARTIVAVVLRWKKATTFLTRPSKRLMRGTCNTACETRFNVCEKHLIWGINPASLTSTYMLHALSVTTAMLWADLSSLWLLLKLWLNVCTSVWKSEIQHCRQQRMVSCLLWFKNSRFFAVDFLTFFIFLDLLHLTETTLKQNYIL